MKEVYRAEWHENCVEVNQGMCQFTVLPDDLADLITELQKALRSRPCHVLDCDHVPTIEHAINDHNGERRTFHFCDDHCSSRTRPLGGAS